MEEHPNISVIVPVHNGGPNFRLCLDALLASTPPPSEIIVVDDASTDGSAATADDYGVSVFRLARRSGPAAARNHGARQASGEILLFVDADVLLRPESVEHVAAAFRKDLDLAAVFGSYDDAPAEQNFLSQYKNLFHHFTHQQSSTAASTFWAGCGAVRRDVFLRAGGFDQERYDRPAIEDLELGYRLTDSGHKILLDKRLQVKHLKCWDIKSLLRADIFNRAVPWSRLILERGRVVNDLNLRLSERVSAGLAVLAVAALAFSLLQPRAFYAALFLWALVFALNIKLYGFFRRRKGIGFAALAFPFHLFYYLYSAATFALCWARHLFPGRRAAGRFIWAGSKVFRRWDYPVFLILTGLSFASIVYFAWHWFSHGGWLLSPVTFSLATVVLALKLVEHQARWFILPLMRRPGAATPSPGLKVAVVTTFVPGGEPLGMLEKTLRALVTLTYPHDTWVLDEGDDERVRALCLKLGANHFSRKNLSRYQEPSGTFQSLSKHGNYNAWLHEIGFDRYEFVTAFDPDHVPDASFLNSVLGYFEDAEVGYVQAPAAYYNQGASFIARGAAEETYSYYSCTQMAAYALGHPFVTGCHNSHRMAALQEVGGFAPHNADDLLLTQFYRNCGWRGVYVPRILARGLVPVDWDSYLGQQVRWARSIMDVKFRLPSSLARKSSLKQRFITFLDGLVYLQGSATIPVLVLLLAVMLATGGAPHMFSSTLLFAFAAMCAVLQLAAFYRQRFFLDWRKECGLHWRARVLRYAKWPYVLLALRDVILRRGAPYTLTRKVSTGARATALLWPHLLTILFISAAWIGGMLRGYALHPLLHVCAAVVVTGTLLLLLTERLEFPAPYDESQSGAVDERKTRDAGAALPDEIPVSIVLGTRDRPAELRECLSCLAAQVTPRPVEIIVVDNNPDSGLTPPVVAEFSRVLLIDERRGGVAYARNAGIAVSSGEIIVTVDDDVTMPPDWLEKLLAPFEGSGVAIVSGNVLPRATETLAERLFEAYGGLGRGEEPFEVNQNWFEQFRLRAVPTWELGGTANAAFRASIFSHPSIGMMEETLGPGMPTGVGEDTYLFYKSLRAGVTLCYEPGAYVWHKHRRDLTALRRQIYNYSKGHVAYHLTTLIRDGDLRALTRLAVGLPLTHVGRLLSRAFRRREHQMFRLTLVEIAGNLAGPWSLWRARRRVRREGRCAAYVPVSSRASIPQGAPRAGTESLRRAANV
ncbi:MAG TPA: glycosyltransferase [Pyrinomonadaceae bacterium]|nr:glycosyltransferase [Pyrinomonadaceae bacterium]